MRTDVAIIIPVFNQRLALETCLAALAEQSHDSSDIHVFVVDNGSTQPIKDVVDRFAFARYLQEDKPGSYSARNKALSLTKQHAYIGFTDADCIPDQNWVKNAVSKLHAPQTHALGGHVDVFSQHSPPSVCELYEILFSFPQHAYVEKAHFSVTANFFIDQHTLHTLGLFNDALLSGGDAEYGYRLKLEGITLLYAPDVIVKHPARSSIKSIMQKDKRKVGGSYQLSCIHRNRDQAFEWPKLIRGFAPPVRAWFKITQQRDISISKKCSLCLLFILLKYYKNTLRIAYKLKLTQYYERV